MIINNDIASYVNTSFSGVHISLSIGCEFSQGNCINSALLLIPLIPLMNSLKKTFEINLLEFLAVV